MKTHTLTLPVLQARYIVAFTVSPFLWVYICHFTDPRFNSCDKGTMHVFVWPCIVTDSLWIKPTDAPNSNFIGIKTLHVSGSLSVHHQEFLAVHRLWYILCSCDDRLLPGVGWNGSSILLLVANGHHNCIKCTKADVRLRTPDDGHKGCPKHVES